jgi:hypothetical protein
MRRLVFTGALFIGIAAASCGKSAEQTQAEQAAQQAAAGAQQAAAGAQQAAQGAANAATAAQQGMAQMMQGLQQMSQAANAGGPVKVVDYEVLKGLIPEYKGWERSGVKGKTATMGVTVSSAEGRYEKDGQNIKLEIVDTSFNQMILAPFMMFARAGYEERSDDGYKKGMTLAGHPGFESFEKNGRDAEVHLLVANRFLVNAEGSGVESPEPVRALVQTVDLGKLAGLK